MTSQLINSSFTLRPSTSNRDRPELTLRQTEASRIPSRETTTVTSHCGKWGRAFKRQRLFMDRSLPFTDHSYYANTDQYISEDEYDTPIIRRRVSTEFPSRHRVTSFHENNYWKTRCLGMQTFCDDSRNRLMEAEEDQRQLRQRIRELEEQLLLQTGSSVSSDEGTSNRGNIVAEEQQEDEDMHCTEEHKTRAPPALVIEIKENHQAVSSCFYMTDGEGLNESYDFEMEDEENQSMNVVCGDELLRDMDDDRNDVNVHQQRRG